MSAKKTGKKSSGKKELSPAQKASLKTKEALLEKQITTFQGKILAARVKLARITDQKNAKMKMLKEVQRKLAT